MRAARASARQVWPRTQNIGTLSHSTFPLKKVLTFIRGSEGTAATAGEERDRLACPDPASQLEKRRTADAIVKSKPGCISYLLLLLMLIVCALCAAAFALSVIIPTARSPDQEFCEATPACACGVPGGEERQRFCQLCPGPRAGDPPYCTSRTGTACAALPQHGLCGVNGSEQSNGTASDGSYLHCDMRPWTAALHAAGCASGGAQLHPVFGPATAGADFDTAADVCAATKGSKYCSSQMISPARALLNVSHAACEPRGAHSEWPPWVLLSALATTYAGGLEHVNTTVGDGHWHDDMAEDNRLATPDTPESHRTVLHWKILEVSGYEEDLSCLWTVRK
eukprot:SAG31_NODE_806_length_11957_cov_2.232670_12_plen_338_part_00